MVLRTRRSAGVHADSAPDPRLVALGLVAAPVEDPPAAPLPTPPPAPERIAPVAPPPRLAPAPALPAIPVSPAQAPEGVRTLFSHRVRARGRSVTLELRSDGLELAGVKDKVEWSSVRAIQARHGSVRIVTGSAAVTFVPELDGVAEPSLAPVFAEIALDASSGAPPRTTLLRTLRDTVAQLKDRTQEEDDPYLPLLVGGTALLFTILLAVMLPGIIVMPFREAHSLPPDVFALYPRVSPLDPRVALPAILGGLALGALTFQLAAGESGTLRARGILRGWLPDGSAPRALARRLIAIVLLSVRRLTLLFAISMALLVPLGRERVLVDDAGLHLREELPMFDRDIPWSAVASATLLSGDTGYGVTIRAASGTIVTTRDHVFYGLSEYELYQFSQRHLRR